jgi:hypothetical protein
MYFPRKFIDEGASQDDQHVSIDEVEITAIPESMEPENTQCQTPSTTKTKTRTCRALPPQRTPSFRSRGPREEWKDWWIVKPPSKTSEEIALPSSVGTKKVLLQTARLNTPCYVPLLTPSVCALRACVVVVAV